MTRLRFTLAQLMAIVLFIGIGFAAVRASSLLWASAVFTLTVAVLSAGILAAMVRKGRARLTWAGFALFGWVYLGTTFGPWTAANGVGAPPYVTRWGLDYWDSKLSGSGPLQANRGPLQANRIDTAPPGEVLYPRYPLPLFPPDSFHFRRIGHSLAAILFGLVGAVVGRLLATKDEQPKS